MDIEQIAVSTVIQALGRSEILKSDIKSNDRTPAIDGNILLYKRPGWKKADILGYIAVQVKGTKSPKVIKNGLLSYPVELDDLNCYRKVNGAIYFVVDVSNLENHRIYYKSLLPLTIIKYQKKARGKKTVTVHFDELPKDLKAIEDIFRVFQEHASKQVSLSTNYTIPSFDDLVKGKSISQIKLIPTTTNERFSDIQTLLEGEFVVYAQIENTKQFIPLGFIDSKKGGKIERTVNESISVKGVEYFQKIKGERYYNKIVLKVGFGFGIEFVIQPDMKAMNFSLEEPSNYLSQRFHETTFVKEVIEAGGFSIGANHIKLEFETNEISSKITELESRIKELGDVIRLLDKMNIKDLDVSTFGDKDYQKLDWLVSTVLKGQLTDKLDSQSPFVFDIQLGKDRIVLLQIIDKTNKTKATISDFFDTQYSFAEVDDDKKSFYLVPPYIFLSSEQWENTINIDFSSVCNSFQTIFKDQKDPSIFDYANITLLNILLAYDKTGKDELFQVAKNLADWILAEAPNEVLPDPLRLLNSLQVTKRERDLNDDEKQSLLSIANDSTGTDPEIERKFKIGAHLLLGEQNSASYFFKQLSSDDQEEFKTWPIYRFWVDSNSKDPN